MNWRTGVIVLAVALSGCGGGINGLTGQKPFIRAFNAVNGSSSVSVVLKDSGGNVLGTTPATGLGSYNGLPNVQVSNTNATSTIVSSGVPIYTSGSFLYRINSSYTVIAGGTPGSPYVLTLNDDQQDDKSGQVGLRAVHAGTNQGSVDVYLLSGATTSVTGATPVFSGVGLGTGSASGADGNGYVSEPLTASGTFTVVVTAHGSTVPIASSAITLFPRVYYSAIIYDSGVTTQVQVASDRY
jgi:hypothetical protein